MAGETTTTSGAGEDGAPEADVDTFIESSININNNHFDTFPEELVEDLQSISTLSSSEYYLISESEKLSLEFQPRILSMLDFVPCYDLVDGTYTETAAQNLINTKRDVLQASLDEIRADTDVFYDGLSSRGSRIRKPFQSNVETSGMIDSVSDIYDADKYFDKKMFLAYKEIYNKYHFIDLIEQNVTSNLEKYSEITTGDRGEGYTTVPSQLDPYQWWMTSQGVLGDRGIQTARDALGNILDTGLNADVHPINVIRDSLILIIYNFCDHSVFFQESGFNDDAFFGPIKRLRGKALHIDVYGATSETLTDFAPYNAIYDGNFSDAWHIRLAAMLFTLSERATILSMGNPSFDTELINAMTDLKDVINASLTTSSTKIEKYNLLTKTGLFDAIMTISTFVDDDDTTTEMNNLITFYSGVSSSIHGVIVKIKENRTISNYIKNLGDFFNYVDDIKMQYEDGDVEADNSDGVSLLIEKVLEDPVNGFGRIKAEILNTNLQIITTDGVDYYKPNMSANFDGDNINREIAHRLMKYFCFPSLDEEDYPMVDQEFMFLVCAISDILANKLSFAHDDSSDNFNASIFQPIFETYITEKFQLWRAKNALQSVRNRLENITDGLGGFVQDYLIGDGLAASNTETSLDADKHFYTKRSINNKVKVWYDSVQNYRGNKRLILEKYNLNEEFKNSALEIFMKDPVKHIMDPDEVRERTKKILSIGLPIGLIDELERLGMYKEDPELTSYIEIKVHKRNFLNDDIRYKPKPFWFKLDEDIVFNNFKTYTSAKYLTTYSSDEEDLRLLGSSYDMLSNRKSFDNSYTTYDQFIQKNTSILNLGSFTYDTVPWLISIDAPPPPDPMTQPFRWAKRNLDSKLYQYYIQSLYGIEISPESILDDQSLTNIQDYSSYLVSLDKPDLFKNILEQKSVMFNSTKTYNEITKKQLFDKIFHVLIDTEDFELTDGGSDVMVAALNALDVKYDDFYVTMDIYNPPAPEEEDTGGDTFVDIAAAATAYSSDDKPVTTTGEAIIPGAGPDGEECFVAGTKISAFIKDKIQYKNIEDVVTGDLVLTYNLSINKTEIKPVINTVSPLHSDIIEFTFNNGTSTRHTYDHPYFVVNKGWSSYAPMKTRDRYGKVSPDLLETLAIEIGDFCINEDNSISELTGMKVINYEGPIITYNIHVSDNTNYFADGILVHNKTTSTGGGGGVGHVIPGILTMPPSDPDDEPTDDTGTEEEPADPVLPAFSTEGVE